MNNVFQTGFVSPAFLSGILATLIIFYRTMENLLKEIPRVIVYLDDILVTGENVGEHLEHLREVLSQIQKAGMRLKEPSAVL